MTEKTSPLFLDWLKDENHVGYESPLWQRCRFWEQYQAFCISVESLHGTEEMNEPTLQNHRLIHTRYGAFTEIAELLDALKKHFFYGKTLDLDNIIEEVGDYFWYTAIAFSISRGDSEAFEHSMSAPRWGRNPVPQIDWQSGNAEDSSLLYETLSDIPTCSHPTPNHAMQLCQVLGLNPYRVARANHHKLSARYSSGSFSQEEALNRDLDNERDALESNES